MEGYFRRLETENSIETRSWDQSRRSLTAHSRPGGEIEAEQGVTFDVMSFTLRDDEGEKLWVRQNTFRIDSSMSDLTYNALESGASRLRTAAPRRCASSLRVGGAAKRCMYLYVGKQYSPVPAGPASRPTQEQGRAGYAGAQQPGGGLTVLEAEPKRPSACYADTGHGWRH